MLSTSEFNRVLSSLENNLNITHAQAHHLTIAISQTACADWSVVTLQSEGQFKEFMCSFRVHAGELQMTTLYYCQVKDNSSLWSVPVTRTATAPAATTKPAEDHYLVFNPAAEAVYYFAAVEPAAAPAVEPAPARVENFVSFDRTVTVNDLLSKVPVLVDQEEVGHIACISVKGRHRVKAGFCNHKYTVIFNNGTEKDFFIADYRNHAAAYGDARKYAIHAAPRR
jgi:hypothetical protein